MKHAYTMHTCIYTMMIQFTSSKPKGDLLSLQHMAAMVVRACR